MRQAEGLISSWGYLALSAGSDPARVCLFTLWIKLLGSLQVQLLSLFSLPFFCHAFCFHLTSKLNAELSSVAFNNVWKMS